MSADLHFDGWTLRRNTGELARGTTRTRLQGQPLQVLEALLAHPGELVTREQLTERLWPQGVVVDFDTALNSAVRRLRTALDDHAENPRYIETIPRRGYRFIGTLEAEPGADPIVAGSSPIMHPAPIGIEQTRGTGSRPWVVAASAGIIALAALAAGHTVYRGATLRNAAPPQAFSATARERYERGRFFLERRDIGDTTRALALFEEALRSQPSYAEAWAAIASVRWIDTMEGRVEREAGLALTRDAATNALSRDPSSVEAMLRLANYHHAKGDRSAGAELTRRARELSPEHPLVLAYRASDAASAGRFNEAIALQRRAVQHGPLDVPARHNLAAWLFLAGRFEEARAELSNLRALNPPRYETDGVMDGLIGQTLLLQGEYPATLAHAEAMPAGVARDQLEALAYSALGREAEATAALQRLADHVPDRMAYLVAEVHAYRGERDAAFEWLQRSGRAEAVSCQPGECWPRRWQVALPLLQSLHADQRWQAVSTLLARS